MSTQAQLVTFSQAGAWGEAEKPCWDMAFMLIVPSTDTGCELVFSLTAMWTHPHQACLYTLGEAACKLLLLADDGPDWPYTFVWMNNTMFHVPLSSEGCISTMTDSVPSTNACSQLHQLQIQKLLQHGGWAVCPEGPNGEHKALQFTFQELPLWNAAAMDEPTQDPPQIELDLSSVQPNSMTTSIQAPTNTLMLPPSLATTVEPSHDITVAINQQFQGPWSGCSRLPLSSQPLYPSTVFQRESHHQQP